jgi:ABC-type multidrug transport system ATPase subunit
VNRYISGLSFEKPEAVNEARVEILTEGLTWAAQHDILWETLTARQHMMFYGRLKNLKADELKMAVVDGLKQVFAMPLSRLYCSVTASCGLQVNLLHVIDEMAGTFSGGMKRRLSVAISMIGQPLCCYLVSNFSCLLYHPP